jgi:Mg2+-importing ATPase
MITRDRRANRTRRSLGTGPGPGMGERGDELLSLPMAEIMDRLGSSPEGLTSDEARARLEVHGYNEIATKARASAVISFLSHFKSPVTIILIVAAILSAGLGDFTDAVIIISIVLVSVTLDYSQEYRAERAADQLRKRVASTAAVLRDGVKQEIDATELVPGDVVSLSVGDIVPADAIVTGGRDCYVDQSALTGESFPAEKASGSLNEVSSRDPSKWSNYLFMGTSVTNGTATALVVKTGTDTQYGEIAKRSAQKRPDTEFERALRRFGLLIMQVTFVLVVFVFLANALFKHTPLESVLFAVALTVGLTPGLLPMILSINLARGAISMSKKGVIVKRLAAIQNFGSMDILCADKTGTLTENRVTVILHVDIEGRDSDKVFLYSYLNSAYQTGLKSPLDEAILNYKKEVEGLHHTVVDEVPFDFVRKRLSVVVNDGQETVIITKGAPEEIAKIVTSYDAHDEVRQLDSKTRITIQRKYRELSAQGLRVLGVSYRKPGEGKRVYSIGDESDMVFLGFIAFMDPLKETAGESIELLRRAGVKLKVLTGDNEAVAGYVGQQLGFQIRRSTRGSVFDQKLGYMVRTDRPETMNIVRSSEIESMTDDVLARVAETADIFAMVTPGQKSRIISVLKSSGHVVGYIGDGINDAPSMRVADVSISVANAVDIAKESAEIILLQNDLKIIRDGVIEGRKTFGNTLKYILMAISSNFGNMFSAAVASLFLTFLPMLPIQILLNSLLYSFAQLAIPTDNVDDVYVQRPQRLNTTFIRNFMLFFGPISSVFDFLTFFVMIFVFKASGPLFQTAWFVESLFTQSLVIFVIRTRTTPFFHSKPNRLLVFNVAAVLVVALLFPFSPLAGFFGFVPLPYTFLLVLMLFTVVYLGLVELVKMLFYGRLNLHAEAGNQ